MSEKRVISFKNLPSKLPLNSTILFWLFFDRLTASDLVLGVFYTIATVLWIVAITSIWNEKHTDISDMIVQKGGKS